MVRLTPNMTGQNRSSAVMAQRREPPDSLDFFPTPPWATRALCEELKVRGLLGGPLASAWDPACGEGDMARPLAEYFDEVVASDIHDYGHRMPEGAEIADFLDGGLFPARVDHVDWIITNPPFNKAQEFIKRGLKLASTGVAVLVRTAFLEGGERARELFDPVPPGGIFQFVHRPVMARGRLRDPDLPFWQFDDEKEEWVRKTPSTATAYAWIVFRPGRSPGAPTSFHWIARGSDDRRRLTRPGDYPPLPPEECRPVNAEVLV